MTVPVPGSGAPALMESWIEVINLGPTTDGAGWRITVSGLTRTLPLGTIIPSHGYLVLYRHDTLFDLSASPLVYLNDPSGSPADSVKPPLLQPGQTFGRVPDGAGWQISNVPTPGSPNTLTPPATNTPLGGAQATLAAIQTQLAQPLPTLPSDLSGTATALPKKMLVSWTHSNWKLDSGRQGGGATRSFKRTASTAFELCPMAQPS